MKTFAITLGTVTLAVVLVVAGIWLGTNWTRNQQVNYLPGYNMMGAGMMGGGRTGMPFGSSDEMPCDENWGGYGMQGYHMMEGDGACPGTFLPSDGSEVSSLQDAQKAVEAYLDQLDYQDLHVTEVMEFERNFYAIAAEEETGIGALELLVDKRTGGVGLEPGPNMMWNAEYGMHGDGSRMGMMGSFSSGEMTLSPAEAQDVAQRWLDANLAGRTAGEADPFYGYYTHHFLNNGEIEGMLSVHGDSGEVWYHSWHGDFIDMMGDDHD